MDEAHDDEVHHDPDGICLADLGEAAKFLDRFDDDPETEPDKPDIYENEQHILETVGVEIGNKYFARRDKIPLRIVADLVIGWRAIPKQGDWLTESVFWCARQSGKGNRSWWISTLDLDLDTFRLWRLSYGGKGKKVPTVTEVANYKRQFAAVPLPAV